MLPPRNRLEWDNEEFQISDYYKSYMQQPVFARLSNHQYFTGHHRERFDSYGFGRGRAGRETVCVVDGMTESYSRPHEVYSTANPHYLLDRVQRQPVHRPFTVPSYAYSKLIWVYRNGDAYHEGERIVVKQQTQDLPQLLALLSRKVKPIGGVGKSLYDQDLNRVRHIDDIEDGAKYLLCEGDGPTRWQSRLRKFLSDYVVWL